MTVKEASVRFHLDEKMIRKCYRDEMIIGVYKNGRSIVIPDDTIIIPLKRDIQSFLLQIIQFKNNPSIPISRRMCPNQNTLCAVIHYLFLRGFIGELKCGEKDTIEQLFSQIMLTDDGFAFIMGNKSFNMINTTITVPIQINPSAKVGLINIA